MIPMHLKSYAQVEFFQQVLITDNDFDIMLLLNGASAVRTKIQSQDRSCNFLISTIN